MALRDASATPTDTIDATTTVVADKPPVSAAASTPLFEDDMEAAAAAAAGAQTDTAVTITKEHALSLRKTLDTNTALKGLKDSIPTDELEKLGFSVFPRVTASLEGFMVDKNKRNLGRRLRLQVVSWSNVTLVTPGEKNDAEANKLIRTTYRGEQMIDGTSVHDYMRMLKEQGYKNAAVKNYAEIYGMLAGYMQLEGDAYRRIDIPEDEQQLYQVSLSPQSLGQWGAYLINSAIRKARGFSDDAAVTLAVESRTLGANTFPYATFNPKWA